MEVPYLLPYPVGLWRSVPACGNVVPGSNLGRAFWGDSPYNSSLLVRCHTNLYKNKRTMK